jgi:fructose-1,6-bisphosphatase/inositol monophosphatase family enzyme
MLGFERYKRISYNVRKTRMLGSAALAMAYIACGRLDAYVEEQISLWDIAAGQLHGGSCRRQGDASNPARRSPAPCLSVPRMARSRSRTTSSRSFV